MDVTELVELLSRFGFSGLLADGVDSNRLASVTAMACASLGIPERFVADEAFATALREAVRRDEEPPPGPGFVVRGYVRNEFGAPIVGATVDVFDQDLRTRQPLGRTTRTDERGRYVMPYTRESFSRREKRAADLIVSVAPRPPAPAIVSELLWNAPAVAVVHLTSAPMQPRDAFAILSAQIAPLLEAIPTEGRPALKPEQLDETDVPFLVRETERAADELSRFLQAHRFAIEIGCHPSFVFGCLMHGVNGPYRDYVRTPASAHRAALERSFVANTVRRFPREEVERYIALLQRAAARDVIDEQTPDNVLAPFWRSALSSPGALEAFTSVVADSDRSLEDTWATLRAHPALKSSLFGIEQVAKLADATGGHAPLLRAVNERLILGQPGRPGDTPWSRFVALSRADLARLIDQVGAPKGVPGSDEAKQRAIYVEALDRALDEIALPERLASRVRASNDPAVREVASFLAANPSFDLLANEDDEVLARMSDGGRSRLRVFESVARLVPRTDTIVKIIEQKFEAPEAIAAVPLSDFKTSTIPQESGAFDPAKGAHRNAHAYTTLRSAALLEKWVWDKVDAQPATKPITLGTLFGSMDHCACDECSSVDGPAAYLVALWNTLSAGAKAAVLANRADIATLPLSCANTTTPMPTIDLVLEVLENVVLAGSVDRETARTEDELRTWPRNLRSAAYAALADKTFPWTLPFDPKTELVRSALVDLGTTRPELAELLRPSTPSSDRWVLEACEYFAIPTGERTNVFVAASPGLDVVLGVAATTEIAMRDFLRRTHARFEDVQVAAAVIGADIELYRPDDCSLDGATVRAKTASALAQLSRFLRLAYRTKVDIRDIVALSVLEAKSQSLGEALVALWRICRWRDDYEVTLLEAASWHRGDIGSGESLCATLGLTSEAYFDTLHLLGLADPPAAKTGDVIDLAARLSAVNLTANEARWLLGESRRRSPAASEATLDERVHALSVERDAIAKALVGEDATAVAARAAAFDDAIEQLLARAYTVERWIVAKALRKAVPGSLGNALRAALEDIDATGTIKPASLTTARSALRAIERFAFVVQRFALDATEIEATLPSAGASAWWTIDATTGEPTTQLDGLLAIAECARLRRELPVLADHVVNPCAITSGDLTAALGAVAVACGWTVADDKPDVPSGAITDLAAMFDLAAQTPLARVRSLSKIAAIIDRAVAWRAFLLETPPATDELKALVAALLPLGNLTTSPSIALDDLRKALERSLPASQRVDRMQEVADRLRERCRDALFAYLDDKRTPDAPTLFDQYLIDPLVSACQRTSRVKSAIGSLQLLIQRALMNPASVPELGPDPLAAGTAATWQWMQNYRKWQANRKVFLYPENWIEPELRDNKSRLFEELEGTLSQQDITATTVEAAYQQYLRGLHEVSRLEIVAIHTEDGGFTPDGRAGCSTTHVVGRRWSQPRTHYYRQRHGGVWTPWEKLEADIDGDHVIMAVHAGRPTILWAQIREGRSPAADRWPPWEIRLSWIERVHGHWGAKQTFDPGTAIHVYRQERREKVKDEDGKEVLQLMPSPSLPTEDERFAFIAHDEPGPLRVTVYYGNRFNSTKVEHTLGDIRLGTCGQASRIPALLPQLSLQQDSWPLNAIADHNPGLVRFASTASEDSQRSGVMTGRSEVVVEINGSGKARLLTMPSVPYSVAVQPRIHKDSFFFGDFASKPFVYQNDNDTLFIERSKRMRASNRPPSLEKAATAFAGQLDVVIRSKLPWTNITIEGDDLPPPVDAPAPGNNPPPPQPTEPPPEPEPPYFRTWMFEHQHACRLLDASEHQPLDSVLAREMQTTPIEPRRKKTFAKYYLATTPHRVTSPYPTDKIEFDPSSPHAIYNWELFFHIPFFIAVKLMQNERFEEALPYLQMIFDPSAPGTEADRVWQFLPFRPKQPGSAVDLMIALQNGTLGDAEVAVVASTLADYRNEPFNPHLIARLRPSAYMRAVVMRYLDCLIGWGDQLFGRLTLESLNQAMLMYTTAAKLLGDRPTTLPRKPVAPPPTLASIKPAASSINPAFGDIGPGCDVDDTQPAWPLFDFDNFCPSPNTKLLAYWDTIEDRLFKLRNCQDLEGNVVDLPLFEPPIDPALLVRAAAAGVDISTIVRDNSRLPAYRFSVVLQKALELCNDVRALGAELQSAIEKRDAEALARLRQSHEISALDGARTIRKGQVEEARQSLAALERQRNTIELRRKHYQEELQRRNRREEQAQLHGDRANALNLAQGVLESIAAVFHATPTLSAGSATFITTGGPFVAAALQSMARNLATGASLESHRAGRALTEAGYDRRVEEWALQGRLAASELLQIDKQLVAAEIRLAIAERELDNHDRLRDNARSIDAQMRSRFSNLELFDWMVRQCSTAYYHAFRQALEMARKAETCFLMERGEVEVGGKHRSFIGSAQWDDLRQGLLAGHRLHRELRQMEVAYLDENTRDLEITKHISINQIDAEALMILRATGRCDITLSESLFDLDYPSHYQRRLKSVSVTIPAITGPHTNVNATLSLVSSEWRTTARAKGEPTKLTSTTIAAGTSIVTSSGQNDAGTFEQNLRDERYLPFEGAGAVSKWTLELPSTTNAFDMDSITDVILHVRYTARDESKAGARVTFSDLHGTTRPPMTRLFSLKHDFAREWAMATRPGASFEMSLDFRPFAPRWPRPYSVKKVTLFINSNVASEEKKILVAGISDFTPLSDTSGVSSMSLDDPAAPLLVTTTLPMSRVHALGWHAVVAFDITAL